MQTMTESPTLPAIPLARAKPTAPTTLTTTLYDLIATLQDAAGPDEDDLVVVAVLHLIDPGRLTWQQPPPQRRRVMHYASHEA
jgi:hypothetical protein